MNSLGERLRLKRMEGGVSLDQVAGRTKIGARLLAAIESDDLEQIPGGVFRRSFVRQYALALGFTETDIASDLDRITVEGPSPEEIAAQTARSMPRRAAGRLSEVRIFEIRPDSLLGRALQPLGGFIGVVIVALLCSGVYRRWQDGWPEIRRPKVDRISANPANALKPASSAPAATTAEASRTVAPTLEVALHATEPTWVSVTSDGRRSFSSALKGGAVKTVAAAEIVRILVGNAGGLELILNGKPVGPLGPRGQVRVVELTSTGAQIQTTPRKSAPAAEPL